MLVTPSRPGRIDLRAFILSALAAPGSAFLIWAVIDLIRNRAGGEAFATFLLGGVLLGLLFSLWGALPAAAFGALVLVPLE